MFANGAPEKLSKRKLAPAWARVPLPLAHVNDWNRTSTLIGTVLRKRAAQTLAACCIAAKRWAPRDGSLKPWPGGSRTRRIILELPFGQPISRIWGTVRSTCENERAGLAEGSMSKSGDAEESQWDTDDPP